MLTDEISWIVELRAFIAKGVEIANMWRRTQSQIVKSVNKFMKERLTG